MSRWQTGFLIFNLIENKITQLTPNKQFGHQVTTPNPFLTVPSVSQSGWKEGSDLKETIPAPPQRAALTKQPRGGQSAGKRASTPRQGQPGLGRCKSHTDVRDKEERGSSRRHPTRENAESVCGRDLGVSATSHGGLPSRLNSNPVPVGGGCARWPLPRQRPHPIRYR